MAKAKRQREEPCYICGHYHNYEGGERCNICGHVLQQASVHAEECSAMPTQILPGFLYVGSYDHASRLELLKAMGITHILSLVPSCQELYKNTLRYHTVSSSPADFQECFDYIDEVRIKQKRVVVHCMTGVAKGLGWEVSEYMVFRSPAVVVAYLMKLRGWTLKESFAWVKDRHAHAELSRVDAERMQLLELRLFGTSSTGYQPSSVNGAGSSSGPFGVSWLLQGHHLSSQGSGRFQLGSAPSLSFGEAQDHSSDFVFSSRSRGPKQSPSTGQAAMDV